MMTKKTHNYIQKYLSLMTVMLLSLLTNAQFPTFNDPPMEVGNTPITSSVGADGSSIIQLPLQLPDGTAGKKPTVQLVYSSNAPLSYLGLGWSMSGLSAITRGDHQLLIDGNLERMQNELEDAYYLDGQRLIHIDGQGQYGHDGSKFRTRIDNFEETTVVNPNSGNSTGPESFFVDKPDGVTYYYGTGNQKLNHPDGTVLVWPLTKIMDCSGNFIEYEYEVVNQELLIKEIRYTGNDNVGLVPYNKIKFSYSLDDYERSVYIQGDEAFKFRNKLDEILIETYGYTFKRYVIEYNSAAHGEELKSIQECGAVDCLNPIYFEYSRINGFGEIWMEQETNMAIGGNYSQYYTAELNQDGYDDVLKIGYACSNSCGIVNYQFYYNDPDDPGQFSSSTTQSLNIPTVQNYINPIMPKGFTMAEFNGDGYSDIALVSTQEIPINSNSQLVYKQNILQIGHSPIINNAYSFTSFTINGHDYVPDPVRWYGKWDNILTGDFDGDSKMDIMTIHYNGDEDLIDQEYNVRIHKSGGINGADRNQIVENTIAGNEILWNSIEKVLVIDYDGNGDSEIMIVSNTAGSGSTAVLDYVFDTGSQEWEIEVLHVSGVVQPNDDVRIGDFNGDRISDLLFIGSQLEIFYGRGNGLYNSGYHDSGWQGSLPSGTNEIIVVDNNADGLSDIYINHDDVKLRRLLNVGKKLNTNTSVMEQSFSDWDYYDNDIGYFDKHLIGSFLGGDELCIIIRDGALENLLTVGQTHRRKISKYRDGFNNETKFTYYPLSYGAKSTSDLYQIGTGASFPVNDVHYNIPVVESHTIPNGMEGQIKSIYKYKGAKLHRQGFGVLGFEEVSIKTTAKPNLRSVQTYEFDAPSMTLRLASSYLEDMSGALTSQAQVLGTKISETKYGYTYFFHSNAPYHYTININEIWELDYLTGSENYSHTSYGWDGAPVSFYQDIGRDFNGQNNTGIAQKEIIYESYNYLCNGFYGKPKETQIKYSRQNQPDEEYDELVVQNPTTGVVTEIREFYQEPKELATHFSNFYLGMPQTITKSASNQTARTTQNNYDPEGRWTINSTNAIGQSQTLSDGYTNVHNKISKNYDLTGLEVTYTYDEFHRVKTMINSLGNTTTIEYDWVTSTGDGTSYTTADNAMYMVTKTQTGKPTVITYYDRHGQIRMIETEGFETSQVYKQVIKYDALGRKHIETLPFDNNAISPCTTETIYDDLDRINSQHTCDVGTTTYDYQYDAHTFETTVTDPQGNDHITVKDATGQIIEATDNGGTLTYTYSARNNMLQVKLDNDVVSTMEYDTYGRQKTLIDPSSGMTNYEYNAYGELELQMTGNGSFPAAYVYDQLGRVTTKTDNSGTTTYQYVNSGNGLNQIQSVSALGEVKNYTYDAYNRIKTVDYGAQNVSQEYFYNSIGKLKSRKINNDQEFIYSYDNNGYQFKTESKAGYESNATTILLKEKVNAFGHTTKYKAVGNQSIDKGHNERNRPTSVEYGNLYAEQYDWTANSGNLFSREQLYGSAPYEEFAYDDLNRLEESIVNSTVACSTDYADNGNPTTSHYAVGDYSYGNTLYQAGMIINSQQLISNTTRDITYTDFNEPATITEGDYELVFTYGVEKTRIKSELYLLNQLIETRTYFPELGYETKTDHQTNTKYHLYYEYLNGQIVSMVVQEEDLTTSTIVTQSGEGYHTVITDYLGSILRVYDHQNTLVAKQSFSAWGRYRNPDDWSFTTNSFSNPAWLIRGYTGHEQLNEFALVHMNGRLYSPLTGRMLSPDNHVQSPFYTQSYNRYSYVWNNPMTFTDPTGEWVWQNTVALAMIGVGAVLIYTSPIVAGSSLGVAAPLGAVMMYTGVGLVMGGLRHFVVAASLAQNPGTTWNQASVQAGLTFGIKITFGGGQNSSPQSKSGGIGDDSDYHRAEIAAGYEQDYDQFDNNLVGEEWEQAMGPSVASTDPYDGMVFMGDDPEPYIWHLYGQELVWAQHPEVLYADGIKYKVPYPEAANGIGPDGLPSFTFLEYQSYGYDKNPLNNPSQMNEINEGNLTVIRWQGIRMEDGKNGSHVYKYYYGVTKTID